MDTTNEQTPSVQQQTTPELPPKKGGFPIKTLLLIVVLALITVGLVALAISPKAPQQITQQGPQITPNPLQTVLTISSVPTPLATASSYTTDVVINSGQNNVTAVQLELIYDPSVLTNVDIVPGTFFVNSKVVLKTIDKDAGRITFVLSSSDNQGILGQGLLAKISFKSLKKNVSTTIDFLPKTQVTAENEPKSVLKTTVGALFNLGVVPTLIVSPTATPSGN